MAWPDIDLRLALKSYISIPNHWKHLEKPLIVQRLKEGDFSEYIWFMLVLNHLKAMGLGEELGFSRGL